MRRPLLVAVALLVVLAPSCAGGEGEQGAAPGSDVPMFRGNAARTGVNPGPGVGSPPQLLWHFQTGDDIYSSPTVVDGLVYVGSMDGHVYALDAATGQEHWRFETGD